MAGEGCKTEQTPEPAYIDIVFDGPPEHEAGRFVEVESPPGVWIAFGTWLKRHDGYWVMRFKSPTARTRELEAKLRSVADGGCVYSGPGRGDCEHFVGLPGKSIPGQHDGDDDTVDVYGKPNGWCAPCWVAHLMGHAERALTAVRDLKDHAEVCSKDFPDKPTSLQIVHDPIGHIYKQMARKLRAILSGEG